MFRFPGTSKKRRRQYEEPEIAADLVKLGDSFRRPCSPCQEYNTAANAASTRYAVRIRRRSWKVCTTILVDDVDDFVCELLPASVGVRASISCTNGEAGIQHQDATGCPGCQVPTSTGIRVSVRLRLRRTAKGLTRVSASQTRDTPP